MISFLSCGNSYHSKFSQEMVLKSQQGDIYGFFHELTMSFFHTYSYLHYGFVCFTQ